MTSNIIPDEITASNYSLDLHAQVFAAKRRAESELEKANELLVQAQTTAIHNGTFPRDFEFGKPSPLPKTILLGDQALTIAFTPGHQGGWDYTLSEVSS